MRRRHREHSCALELPPTEKIEGFIRLPELENSHCRSDPHLRRNSQEFLAIPPRQIRHRAHHPFFPQQAIGKGWNITHVNPSADDGSALDGCFKRSRKQRTDRCKNYCAIQFLGRRLRRVASPTGPELTGELLGLGVTRSCEGVDEFPQVHGHLGDDVGSGTKAVNPQSLDIIPSQPVRPVSDEPRTQ